MSFNFVRFKSVKQLVAAGSTDGIAGVAAAMAMLTATNPLMKIDFTQAFEVNKIDLSKWEPGSKVGFIDLAVNNQDPEMTAAFVRRIQQAGHEIVFIADEHGREAWLKVMGDFRGLVIEPQDRSEELYSSCAILRAAFGSAAHPRVLALLAAGDAGDRFDFTSPLARVFNRAVKSNMGDPVRRPHLARHLAFNEGPDHQILAWMAEYDEIEANHPIIAAKKEDLGDGITLLDGREQRHDVTTLMASEYKGARIVVLRTNGFVKGKGNVPMVSLGCNNKEWNLLEILKVANVPTLGGFAQKANVRPEDEAAAIEAVRNFLNS